MFAQAGTALACRAQAWWRPNALLLIGIVVELAGFVALQGWPPLARTFQLAPIPSQFWWWLLWCIPAALLNHQLRIAWRRRCDGQRNRVVA
jgi:hypothetical protein